MPNSGGSSARGFAIPFDVTSTPTGGSELIGDDSGDLTLTGHNGDTARVTANVSPDLGNYTYIDSSQGLIVNNAAGTTASLQVTASAGVLVVPIPTADPHVAGQFYSVAGVVHVSAG